MTCPYCNGKLAPGSIQSRGAIRWFPDETKRIEWHPWAAPKDGITVAPCGAGPFGYAAATAFYCENCRTVIVKKTGRNL